MAGAPRVAWARAPATAANLGPGFDCLALALAGPALTVHLAPSPPDPRQWRCHGDGVRWLVEGDAAGEQLPPPPQNLVVQAVRAAFAAAACAHPEAWHVRIRSTIPPERGLGSSAAAVVAGLKAANAWLRRAGCGLGARSLLQLAAEVEGHADNAAAALLGGVALAWRSERPQPEWRATSFRPACPLVAVIAVPAARVGTRFARAVLPATLPHADAAFNVARSALLALALARGEARWLRDAMEDRLHQAYRLRLVPWAADLIRRAVQAGAQGACLSGSGPSVLALATPRRAGAVAAALERGLAAAGVPGSVLRCGIAARGCTAGLAGSGPTAPGAKASPAGLATAGLDARSPAR